MSWLVDASALQVVVHGGGLGNRDGADGGGLTVHTGDGEAEARVMGEPDKVTFGVEGDFGDLIQGDARVVSVIDRPLGSVIADEADITGGGYPFPVFDIHLHIPEAVARQRRVVAVVGRTCVSVEARQPQTIF